MKSSDPIKALWQVVVVAGTQRAAAEQLHISQAYLSDLLQGRRKFSAAMLAKLGLESVVVKLGGRPKKATV